MKVSEKGAVSIYGLGRFPVTLYPEQWLKLLEMADTVPLAPMSPMRQKKVRAFVRETINTVLTNSRPN